MQRNLPVQYRIPMLMAGFICLAFGIGTGLLRLGWNIPLPATSMTGFHGPLMVCGFLGTVISLERAVAIGQRWAYAAPLAAGLGGLAFVVGLDWPIGGELVTMASAMLSLATAQIFMRQQAMFTLTLLMGSLSWLLGNLLWLSGLAIAQVAPWWIGFLLLTISGERLELSRFLPPSPNAKATFMAIVVLYLAGAVSTTLTDAGNVNMLSAALLALSVWLLRQDVARHTIRQAGLPRFIAACLVSGYLWLMAGALVGLFAPHLVPGASYDAFMHALLVGFVFSMIFGHAPIIFPAVARVRVPYHPSFYLPLILLHVSVAARIAGDLLAIPLCRSHGGAMNAVALLMFVANTVLAVIRGKRQAGQ